jgi:CHAT domain-containing protein
MSSYTPSIKALAHSRDRLNGTEAAQGQLLISTMPTTPGLTKLSGVLEEEDGVMQSVNGFLTAEQLDQPSVGQVLESLKRCSIAHFACHGYTDHADPSNSGLVFQRYEDCEQPEQDIMPVRGISEANLEHARIAYLSACSTAENRVAQLADEVIHVVRNDSGAPHWQHPFGPTPPRMIGYAG